MKTTILSHSYESTGDAYLRMERIEGCNSVRFMATNSRNVIHYATMKREWVVSMRDALEECLADWPE